MQIHESDQSDGAGRIWLPNFQIFFPPESTAGRKRFGRPFKKLDTPLHGSLSVNRCLTLTLPPRRCPPFVPSAALPRVCKHAKVWSVVCAKLCVGILE
jgi:hypothetical protein